MQALLALVCKDLTLEFRRKEAATLLICLILFLTLIISLGINSALLEYSSVRKLFMPLVWIVSIFVATLSLGRSHEYEVEDNAYEGVVLSGVASWLMFLAKLSSNLVIVLAGHILALVSLAIFLDVAVLAVLPDLMLVSVLVLVGYSALGTLIASLSQASRMRGILLPLLLLPLIFPLFFAALELSLGIIEQQPVYFSSAWFSFLIGLDLIYILLGAVLFEFVAKE